MRQFSFLSKLFSLGLLPFFLVACSTGNGAGFSNVGAASFAANSSATVKRGKTVSIGTFLHWNGSCWAETIPNVKIIKRPKLGRATISRGNYVIPTSICKGIPIRGAKLSYRAYRRGADTFTYRITSGPKAGVYTMRLIIK